MDELAIKIEHVSKQYRLGAIGGGTLTADLQSWWARKRGREDPNSKIGARTDVKIGEKFLALDDINLEVKKGEALGIIGHNGAGKSTLLKLLSRVTAPTSGSISYNGRIASMLEVGTGFHGELTGRENIYMNGAILGMTKKEIESKMEQIIDFSEVRQFIDTPVKRYSSGMYVKLAFSVAAHLDSEIMIMDEVLAVGDMAFQKKCLTKMREAADKEGRTVLYVSHNMNTIRKLCDRCVVLEQGKIIYDGDVEKAISIYSDNVETDSFPTVFEGDALRLITTSAQLGKYGTLTGLQIVGKDNAIFAAKEKLTVRVFFTTKEYIDSLTMGFQLYTEAKDTIGFGTQIIQDLKPHQSYTALFEFDLSNIVEGTYCFRMNLFYTDDGNQYLASADQTTYIYFKVANDPSRVCWHKEWWNRTVLKDFKMLQIAELCPEDGGSMEGLF